MGSCFYTTTRCLTQLAVAESLERADSQQEGMTWSPKNCDVLFLCDLNSGYHLPADILKEQSSVEIYSYDRHGLESQLFLIFLSKILEFSEPLSSHL